MCRLWQRIILEFKDLLNKDKRQALRKALEEGKRIPRGKKGEIELRSEPPREQELDVYLSSGGTTF